MLKKGNKIYYQDSDFWLLGTISSIDKDKYNIIITKCIQYDEIEGIEGVFDNNDNLILMSNIMELLYV